ncbi:hypothetical protein DFH08DRAFT_1089178 [Mycena albidolilacea]|uniref:DUF6589 domain-containing protein n=1 Tax=Mycena albidolilacea TaxID=1033008 RepID=A0AAD7E973_9AGAR|nr:hypothetical protein DFH08DRAFT_1089178 [Mycena albidolilacea]
MSGREFVLNFDTEQPQQHRFRQNNASIPHLTPIHESIDSAASSTPAAASQILEFQLDDGLNMGPDSEGESEPDIPNSWPPTTPAQLHGGGPYSTPRHQNSNLQTTMALDFSGHLFNDIVPDFPSGSQRTQFKWPKGLDVVIEDRILVVLRAIKKAVYHTIAAFLRGQEILIEHHPIAIIELIFHHRKSQEYVNGVPLEPNFALPRYALPPSSRLIPYVPSNSPNTTHNAMINSALQSMITCFEQETRELLRPSHSFMHRPTDPAIKWDTLLLWNMVKNQESIAIHAPAIFTLFTTITVNRTAREKLEAKVSVLAETNMETDSGGPNNDLPHASPPPAGSTPPPGTPAPPPEPDGEDGTDDGTEETDELKGFMDPLGRRDPWQAVTVVILMLLVFRNRFAIVFPIFLGIFAFTCNAHRDIISLLCRLGLSVSYSMILAQLHLLGADSAAQLRLLGAFNPESGPLFLLLFDNVNKMKRAWRPSLGHKDEVRNGTAATAIRLEGVRPGAFLSEPLQKAIREKKRSKLTVDKLYKDLDWTHIRGIGRGTALRIWLKYIPALAHHRPAVEEIFSSRFMKHVLQLRKSVISTMRPTNIDESPTTGAAAVLLNLIGQLAIVPTLLYRWLVMICGDQLTIYRIRKIKWYNRKADNPFEQYHWALPVIQLWHLKWNWQKCIFRLHWHQAIGKGIFGLRHDCHLLERGKFNHEKCDFYPAHHILEDRFEAVVLDALRLLCEESTGEVNGPDVKLLDAVQLYFNPGGQLHDCSFEKLEELAELVYKRYMSNGAAEMALGHSPRPVDVYGPAWTANDADSDSEEEPEERPTGSKAPPPAKKQKRSRAKTGAQPAHNFLNAGDQVMVTLCNFMRMTFWYLELCAATAEGDIGRVFEVIKLLRFSFWGAGSTNYGNELLELACNFLYEWSDNLRLTVLENYLVNSTGKRGHWFELDLLQEHFNFWIKALFNSKSHDFDSKHLSEAVGLNISGISSLRERFPGLFGLKKNGGKHREVRVSDDINRLGAHFRGEHILVWEAGRSHPYQVGNEFSAGMTVLKGGQLQKFLERTLAGDDTPENEMEDGTELPTCPITVVEGSMEVNEFITGAPSE